jgi:hypothetical protein
MTYGRAHDREAMYQIRVKGTLGPEWADWFGGLEIVAQEGDETLLAGPVVDQAALYGLLAQIRNLGLPLISVVRVEPDCG